MCLKEACFNPLYRGNLYLIKHWSHWDETMDDWVFQSPRSGKFVSDILTESLMVLR